MECKSIDFVIDNKRVEFLKTSNVDYLCETNYEQIVPFISDSDSDSEITVNYDDDVLYHKVIPEDIKYIRVKKSKIINTRFSHIKEHIIEDRTYIVKKLMKTRDLREVDAHSTLSHPYILPVTVDFFKNTVNLISRKGICLVNSNVNLSDDKLDNVFYRILSVLDYMRLSGYYHCDIKPDNLVYVNDKVYIIDFGHCSRIKVVNMILLGTEWYISNINDPLEYRDIYALACTIISLKMGIVGKNRGEWLYILNKCNYRRKMLNRMLSLNPKHRPTPNEILREMKWVPPEIVIPIYKEPKNIDINLSSIRPRMIPSTHQLAKDIYSYIVNKYDPDMAEACVDMAYAINDLLIYNTKLNNIMINIMKKLKGRIYRRNYYSDYGYKVNKSEIVSSNYFFNDKKICKIKNIQYYYDPETII
jgi:serine/threonine protein kinase